MVGVSAGEKGPNLRGLAKATAGGSSVEFKVSALPRAHVPGAIGNAEGIDFGSVDVDALGKYDEAVKFEKGEATPEAKSAK